MFLPRLDIPHHPVNDCTEPDCDCGFDPDTAPGGHDYDD